MTPFLKRTITGVSKSIVWFGFLSFCFIHVYFDLFLQTVTNSNHLKQRRGIDDIGVSHGNDGQQQKLAPGSFWNAPVCLTMLLGFLCEPRFLLCAPERASIARMCEKLSLASRGGRHEPPGVNPNSLESRLHGTGSISGPVSVTKGKTTETHIFHPHALCLVEESGGWESKKVLREAGRLGTGLGCPESATLRRLPFSH